MSRLSRASRWLGATSVVGLMAASFTALASPPAQATDWSACLQGPSDRQAVFSRAAERSGVPQSVLLGVSFMESRWDDHDAAPSTSAGYGPLHLTSPDGIDSPPHEHAMGKGDGSSTPAATLATTRERIGKDALSTLAKASALTGVSESRLRRTRSPTSAAARPCSPSTSARRAARRTSATGRRPWPATAAPTTRRTALRFAKQVFRVIRNGEARTTNDGQRVVLRADASARVDRAAVADLGLPIVEPGNVDCPAGLGCESLPAPYEHYGDTPGDYGNHDLANRPSDLDINYIVIHDTEATYDTTLQLVNDPTYVSWHYTLRSVDGHVAQHVDTQDVAWHAGNWYVNMHSIGLEHEGFAADGAAWFTESLYQSSATLVRHLSQEYGVPLDRAHIIGHDQVPGILPANVAGMHWDPGPYWDWQHYFDLLGAPLKGKLTGKAKGVVTVLPGFDDNVQPVTGCDASQPGTTPCAAQGTNFVYLYSQPSLTAPLVKDVGLTSTGARRPRTSPTSAPAPPPASS